MTSTIIMLLPVLFLVGIVVLLKVVAARRGEPQSPFVSKPLLTRHELAFYEKLVEAAERIGAAGVFPQVAMGALLDARKGLDPQVWRTTRNRFDRKIVDFVVVDEDMDVMTIVELDDRTHENDKDRARDAMTSAAGYRTARFRNGHRITVGEIEKGLRRTLAQPRRV